MKVVLLSEIERYCKEHNYRCVGLDTLRTLAIENDDKGLGIAYDAGFAECNQACIEAMHKAKNKHKRMERI